MAALSSWIVSDLKSRASFAFLHIQNRVSKHGVTVRGWKPLCQSPSSPKHRLKISKLITIFIARRLLSLGSFSSHLSSLVGCFLDLPSLELVKFDFLEPGVPVLQKWQSRRVHQSDGMRQVKPDEFQCNSKPQGHGKEGTFALSPKTMDCNYKPEGKN